MSKPLNVLIVEDDPLLAQRLFQYLTGEGFHVCGMADTARKATDIANVHPIDIALVDINLSGMGDGISLAAELMKDRSIAIVFITGDPTDEAIERSRKIKPAGFLLKPFNMKQVAVQIQVAADLVKSEKKTAAFNGLHLDSIHLPGNRGLQRFEKREIAYISADRGHSKIFLTRDAYQRTSQNTEYSHIQTWINMGRILEHLPWYFYRVSRSLTVNLNLIDLITKDSIHIQQHKISLPEGKRAMLIEQLNAVRPGVGEQGDQYD
jgi:DNA-binding LytR/AlgR family response regulator